MVNKLSKRPWRKLVKKMQRKRKRQKIAQQKDQKLAEVELEKMKDPLYKLWLEQQESIEQQQQLLEEKKRSEEEQLWLQRELLAQKQFAKDRLKAEAEESQKELEKIKQAQELELLEKTRQKEREEIKLKAERAAKEFENIMTYMEEYLENEGMKTPSRLECYIESRPEEKSCNFFEKTNCCRFDPGCIFNHKRPLLSRIIFIKHFFQHPLLQQQEHKEYARSDSELEFNEHDLRESYDEFCADVWPVLEEFGTIINFRSVRNVQPHLRGHVFVEYAEKRFALKAFANLQSRYYASKRLNVEFSNIRDWRTGVCGMRSKGLSLDRKCEKGVKCNFLHLLKNIGDKYNMPINNPERSARSITKCNKLTSVSPLISSWNTEESLKNNNQQSRNWRWSESPELELTKAKCTEEKFKSKINKENSSSSKSTQNCLSHAKLKSNTSNSNCSKSTRRSRSKSPYSRHHKSKKKSSTTEKQEYCQNKRRNKSETITERESKESPSTKRRKTSHRRRSNSPKAKYHKYARKSDSRSSLRTEIEKNKKLKR